MNDTPRTDKADKWIDSIAGQMQIELVSVEFARTLERELDAMTKERDMANHYALKWKEQRDALQSATVSK